MSKRKHDALRSAICHDGHAIGLDIGATGVRAAVLSVSLLSDQPSVTADVVAGVELMPGVVTNGMVQDGGALTAALSKLWRSQPFGCRNVILGVSSSQVLVRDLTMPHLKPEQQAQALPFQARDLVALPMDQVVLDFVPLGSPDLDTNQVEGLLVASPREPINAAVAAVERAGLKVVRVDLGSFAVLRAAAAQNVEVGAVIDFGAHLTTIVIHQHGVPRLVRTIARGGEELTGQLAERFQTSRQEAETLKCGSDLDADDKVGTALSEGIAPLLAEIRSSLNYFSTGHPGALLEEISMTGGAASLGGLGRRLVTLSGATSTRVSPVRLVEPASKPTAARDDRWATAMAVGLAMGAAA